MFKKLRNLLKKYKKFDNYKLDIKPNVYIGVDLASDYVEERKKDIKKIDRVKDPNENLKKKLQLIARNAKSLRIKRKNLKRLVKLLGDY